MKRVRGRDFQGQLGVSNRAEGSDDGEVGFGGVDGALGEARRSEGEGGAKETAKAKVREWACVRACG